MSAAGDFVDHALRMEGSEQRAWREQARLASDLEFYGASVGAVRGTVRDMGRKYPGLTHDEVVALASELWAKPVHERRLAAVVLLQTHVTMLDNGDLTRIEGFLRQGRNRALVDPLAVDVVGPMVESLDGVRRARAEAALDRWSADGDEWLRRAALLSPLRALTAGAGDWDRFVRHADSALDGPEIVTEAIETVMRAAQERRAALVRGWRALHGDRTV